MVSGRKPVSTDIVQYLVADSLRQLACPPTPIRFTGDAGADDLLNDLDRHPHAFVLGCLMDRQVKAQRAWAIPNELRKRLGTFEVDRLAALPVTAFEEAMSK